MQVHTGGAKCRAAIETTQLHQNLEDLRNRAYPRSRQTFKFVNKLREKGVEIVNSQLDRHTVVVWIWCRSEAALQYIQKLYESNQLGDAFFEHIQPSISVVIEIDRSQFMKTNGKYFFQDSINRTKSDY